MPYFDIFVIPVRKADKAAYIAHCERSRAVFQELGATVQLEVWGDDVPQGEVTSLPMAVKASDDETVASGYIEWPDKATRDAGWAKMMTPEIGERMGEMPFDGKRMIFGGFETIFKSETAPA